MVEIQFLNFTANKDASFESILAISNNTKVSIIASGTDNAYGKMFPNLRTSRRTGICIRADSYCSDISCFNSLINILWQHNIFDDVSETIPSDVKEGIYKASKGIIDQVIKIFIQMEIEYLQAQIKPQINDEFVYKIVNKYYPGTIIHLKKKIVNSLTSNESEGELTTFEIKCINMLKDILNVTDERFNNHSIANSVRIAHKRSPNANESQIAKLAYNHLKRHKSDNRYALKNNLDYEDERELILSVTERL